MGSASRWLLTALLLVPLAGAVVVLIDRRAAARRWAALSSMLLALVLSLLLLVPWRSGSGARAQPASRPNAATGWPIATDALAEPFFVLTAVLCLVLFLMSWDGAEKARTSPLTLLLLEFTTLGAFATLGSVVPFAFMAATLALLCSLGRLPQQQRGPARTMAVYLSLGLCGLLVGTHYRWFALCAAGCCFWLAIAPLHAWLVQVASEAPTSAAIAAEVLCPAIGGYCLFRFGTPLFSQANQTLGAPLAMVGIASILYGGLCALARRELKIFTAYGTCSVCGYVLLGFAIRTPLAGAGAMILLLGQGLAVALLLYSDELKSNESPMVAMVGWTGWLVAPVLLGQLLVLIGTFQAARTNVSAHGLAVAGSFGLILSGAGAARICYRTITGATGAA